MAKKYYGVIPPIITPVNSDETVDEAGFRGIIDYCLEGGLHGLFVAGTNGDTMALTQKERNHAIQIALDQVHGRVPVMCGVMDTSTKRVIENIKALEQMGGSCAVVTPVFYDRHTSQDETIRHFEEILKATSIDLALYNIPPFVGTKVDAATVIKIAELDKRVVAYKDSSGALQIFSRFSPVTGTRIFAYCRALRLTLSRPCCWEPTALCLPCPYASRSCLPALMRRRSAKILNALWRTMT